MIALSFYTLPIVAVSMVKNSGALRVCFTLVTVTLEDSYRHVLRT